MTPEEIILLLKDKLSINIDTNHESDYGSYYKVVTVNLYLDGDKISSDTFTVPISRD